MCLILTPKAVCSDVPDYCFQDVCAFTWSPWLDDAQLLRFVFAIFLHRGVVDLLVVVLAQLYVCWRIERRIGYVSYNLSSQCVYTCMYACMLYHYTCTLGPNLLVDV